MRAGPAKEHAPASDQRVSISRARERYTTRGKNIIGARGVPNCRRFAIAKSATFGSSIISCPSSRLEENVSMPLLIRGEAPHAPEQQSGSACMSGGSWPRRAHASPRGGTFRAANSSVSSIARALAAGPFPAARRRAHRKSGRGAPAQMIFDLLADISETAPPQSDNDSGNPQSPVRAPLRSRSQTRRRRARPAKRYENAFATNASVSFATEHSRRVSLIVEAVSVEVEREKGEPGLHV